MFIERLWRSVKYEEVYLRAYDNVGEARAAPGGRIEARQGHDASLATSPWPFYYGDGGVRKHVHRLDVKPR